MEQPVTDIGHLDVREGRDHDGTGHVIVTDTRDGRRLMRLPEDHASILAVRLMGATQRARDLLAEPHPAPGDGQEGQPASVYERGFWMPGLPEDEDHT